jgi:hypothetical protein
MHAVHPIFHVSQLEPTTPNTILNQTQEPPPPVIFDGEPEFEILEILNSKVDVPASYFTCLLSLSHPPLIQPCTVLSH